MSLALGAALGPYEIRGLLSVGGMGEVYRAEDTRLGRQVAVKVLPPSCASDPERLDRFQKEARAAGALNHPNVVSIFDIGRHDDFVFLVSELVDGVTLRERLRDGPLPPAVALDYATQIARGLAAAHAQGVVHRDLKPENIMVTRDGLVKILDFGVAKLRSAGAAGNGGAFAVTSQVTLPGIVVGTLAYMSPEQIRGEAVDARSDVFSLGTILYELVAGRHPFERATAADTMSAILRDDPGRLAGIPPGVEWIVRRALEKALDARFQSAGDFAAELSSWRPGTARVSLPSAAAGGPVRTIAVLPFSNVGSDPDSDYFSDGLTEELIHALTRVKDLQVVAWGSAAKLKGRETDLQAIGRQLKVATVLVGSVRMAGDRVRIAVRLVDVENGYYLWSESYDRRIQDLFAIQEEIATAIVATLTRALADNRSPGVTGRRAGNVEAYNLYLKGRFLWNSRTAVGLERSIELFEAAAEADKGFALAHAGIADAYCLLADYGYRHPVEVMPRARSAAERALDLDPRSAEAHASFAFIRSLYDWEWPEAEALYRRAIELNPGYASARHWFALDFLGVLGRFDEATEEILVARRLDPLSLIIHEGAGYLLMLARRYDEAIEAYRSLTDLDPNFYKGYTAMGRAFVQKGMHQEALAMLNKGRAIAGDLPTILGALGQTYALAGAREEARRLIDSLATLAATGHVPSTAFALIHAGLGEADRALNWLERGCDQHELPIAAINIHPAYDSLRDEPRFQALLARMRFPPTPQVPPSH